MKRGLDGQIVQVNPTERSEHVMGVEQGVQAVQAVHAEYGTDVELQAGQGYEADRVVLIKRTSQQLKEELSKIMGQVTHYLENLQVVESISPLLKVRFLKAAISQKADSFLLILDKLYAELSSGNTDKQIVPMIVLLRTLRSINELWVDPINAIPHNKGEAMLTNVALKDDFSDAVRQDMESLINTASETMSAGDKQSTQAEIARCIQKEQTMTSCSDWRQDCADLDNLSPNWTVNDFTFFKQILDSMEPLDEENPDDWKMLEAFSTKQSY